MATLLDGALVGGDWTINYM